MEVSCLAEVVEKNKIVNAAGNQEADIVVLEGVVSYENRESIGDIDAVGCIFKRIIGNP